MNASVDNQVDFLGAANLDTLKTDMKLSTGSGRIVGNTRITSADSPYTVLASTQNLTVATDAAVTVNLPAGVAGTYYRIANSGTAGFALTLNPNGAELLIGVNSAFTLNDGESLIIVYDATDGWS